MKRPLEEQLAAIAPGAGLDQQLELQARFLGVLQHLLLERVEQRVQGFLAAPRRREHGERAEEVAELLGGVRARDQPLAGREMLQDFLRARRAAQAALRQQPEDLVVPGELDGLVEELDLVAVHGHRRLQRRVLADDCLGANRATDARRPGGRLRLAGEDRVRRADEGARGRHAQAEVRDADGRAAGGARFGLEFFHFLAEQCLGCRDGAQRVDLGPVREPRHDVGDALFDEQRKVSPRRVEGGTARRRQQFLGRRRVLSRQDELTHGASRCFAPARRQAASAHRRRAMAGTRGRTSGRRS